MRKASRIVAVCFGILAGIAGLEHGYNEVLQGNARPTSLLFPSWGPQVCDPAKAWHACEPAMSLLSNFLVMGILTIILSLAVAVWAAAFVQRKYGALGLLLISLALLLSGGGVVPPVIGLFGSWAAGNIRRPVTGQPSGLTRFIARLWPWPLVIAVGWLVVQFPIGAVFNDWLKSVTGPVLLVVVALLPLSVWSASAHDVVQAGGKE